MEGRGQIYGLGVGQGWWGVGRTQRPRYGRSTVSTPATRQMSCWPHHFYGPSYQYRTQVTLISIGCPNSLHFNVSFQWKSKNKIKYFLNKCENSSTDQIQYRHGTRFLGPELRRDGLGGKCLEGGKYLVREGKRVISIEEEKGKYWPKKEKEIWNEWGESVLRRIGQD